MLQKPLIFYLLKYFECVYFQKENRIKKGEKKKNMLFQYLLMTSYFFPNFMKHRMHWYSHIKTIYL